MSTATTDRLCGNGCGAPATYGEPLCQRCAEQLGCAIQGRGLVPEISVHQVDFVCLQDYEDAIEQLVFLCVGSESFFPAGPVGRAVLARVIGQPSRDGLPATGLYAKVDRYFRDGPNLHDPKQALAYIKTMALGYREGAQALEWAAARLSKKHGDSHGANETHKAAVAMARAAQELIGEDQ